MAYEHHLFISYKRNPAWIGWVRNFFVPAVETYLQAELGGNTSVFVDERIDHGSAWELELRNALARSRLLVPVLTLEYFDSEWCKRELAIMREREEALGLRTPRNPHGLILPFWLFDGNQYPELARSIQAQKIHNFANASIHPLSPKHEEFHDLIRAWVSNQLIPVLESVPPHDETWHQLDGLRFLDQLTPTRSKTSDGPRMV